MYIDINIHLSVVLYYILPTGPMDPCDPLGPTGP